jgi:hypothetical protein
LRTPQFLGDRVDLVGPFGVGQDDLEVVAREIAEAHRPTRPADHLDVRVIEPREVPAVGVPDRE